MFNRNRSPAGERRTGRARAHAATASDSITTLTFEMLPIPCLDDSPRLARVKSDARVRFSHGIKIKRRRSDRRMSDDVRRCVCAHAFVCVSVPTSLILFV